jgi:putative Holliday junction resolvase
MTAVAQAPARHRSLLAFDFGTRRIGVAVGNTLTGTARPLGPVASGDAAYAAIGRLIDEWQPDALVVGVPTHPDGAPHENTRRAQRFARRLQGRFHLPVHEVDERWSTTEAAARGAADLDAEAAAIVLEQFLRAQAQDA